MRSQGTYKASGEHAIGSWYHHDSFRYIVCRKSYEACVLPIDEKLLIDFVEVLPIR